MPVSSNVRRLKGINMTNEAREDINTWIRVHGLSLTELFGTVQREFLLEFDAAPVLTTDTPLGLQVQVQPERFVLGPDAASILLRLLLDAGVVPKDDKIRAPLGH